MKRLFTILTAAALLVLLLAAPAAAQEAHIYDTVGLLTASECQTLEEAAQKISANQQCQVYFAAVEDYRDYGSGTIFEVSQTIFEAMDFGFGQEKSGVLLILSMDDRDYCLLAHGFGDTALTDYGKDYISERFLDNFGDDDWYGGCMDYLTYTDQLLTMAHDGNVYDRGSNITGGQLWLWSLLLGAVIAAIVCLIQRSAMRKKVRQKSEAFDYLSGDAVDITRRTDRYVRTTVVRHKIETSSNSGSSGGHSHSGGYSGKSGKF